MHPYAQASQTPPTPAPQTPPGPPIQPMVIQEPFTVPDEDSGCSGRRQRSRSRERATVHVPMYTDDESAAVEPQSRVSDRSRSPQGNQSPQRQKGTKTIAEGKKPRNLPKAKKHKPTDSDKDHDAPRNEYQYYLSSQDQHPIHTVHRHRPVPALRMNPLTMMTVTEKENLAQQYKVHEVMTPEGQCSIQTFTF